MKPFGNKEKILVRMLAAICLLLIVSLVLLIVWRVRITEANELNEESYASYQYHYVLIAEDTSSTFWDNIYEGAIKEGKNKDVYIERMGEGLAVSYTREQLIEIAINSGVDGIILEGDESEVQKEMIDRAVDANIPVVTTLNDNYGSERQSFVGITNYDLGREYARQVIKIATKDNGRVLILGDSTDAGAGQNIIMNGFSETLENEGNHLKLSTEMVTVNSGDSFASQEKIRDIFLNAQQNPDIVICLNETNTISAYQAVVDYNLVGQVKIIGYYSSDTILNAIEKEVISSSVVLDAQKMGSLCVDALCEYQQTGYVSDYITLDAQIVNKKNIEEYRENDKKDF